MRRAAIGLLALALLAAPSIPAVGAGSAESAPCLWKKHTKRVTKKVRRHGKPKRLRRVKRWWTCEPLPATFLPAPPPLSPLSEPPPSEEEPGPELARLGVKAKEWSYTLSRPEIASGEVIVELQNQGEDPHDLSIEPEDAPGAEPLSIPTTGPGEQKSKRITLSPGAYRLWCDLPEHDERGMHATLVVGD